jgi:hypothetical protein
MRPIAVLVVLSVGMVASAGDAQTSISTVASADGTRHFCLSRCVDMLSGPEPEHTQAFRTGGLVPRPQPSK